MKKNIFALIFISTMLLTSLHASGMNIDSNKIGKITSSRTLNPITSAEWQDNDNLAIKFSEEKLVFRLNKFGTPSLELRNLLQEKPNSLFDGKINKPEIYEKYLTYNTIPITFQYNNKPHTLKCTIPYLISTGKDARELHLLIITEKAIFLNKQNDEEIIFATKIKPYQALNKNLSTTINILGNNAQPQGTSIIDISNGDIDTNSSTGNDNKTQDMGTANNPEVDKNNTDNGKPSLFTRKNLFLTTAGIAGLAFISWVAYRCYIYYDELQQIDYEVEAWSAWLSNNFFKDSCNCEYSR